MKSDKLEKYVLDNKRAFDDLKPSPDLWKGIEQNLPPERKTGLRTILLRAAAVVVIFIASYYAQNLINKPDNKNIETLSTLESSPEYQKIMEAELFYSSEINFKKKEFFRLTSNSPELQKSVNEELSSLDQIYLQLKEDLSDRADNDEVLEAMIQNYRIKLKILEDMLEQINHRNENNNSHEEIHSAI